jgi:diguanylate cyclase (GGDEF)-like protein/PAS domain S-box-containing protein
MPKTSKASHPKTAKTPSFIEGDLFFRNIVESTLEGVWVGDTEHNTVFINSCLKKLLGYSLEEMQGLSLDTYILDGEKAPFIEQLFSKKRTVANRYELKLLRKDHSHIWVTISLTPLYDEQQDSIGSFAIISDITKLKKQIETREFLSKATKILASSLDYHTTLASVADLAVPHIADWCGIDIMAEDGSISRLALAHVDPTKIEIAYEMQRLYPTNPNSPRGVAQVLRTGISDLIPVITDEMIEKGVQDPRQLAMFRELGLHSFMVVPLKARGKILGTITLVLSDTSSQYTEEDVVFAEELANNAALAIDNSQLHTQAQQDLQRRIITEEKIRHQAFHDALTGLPNRVLLQEELSSACKHASFAGTKCAILFMDLDRFKIVNDSLGHHIGDEVLREVAERLLRCMDASDTVARFGGDEFVLILNNIQTEEEISAVAQKIFATLEIPIHIASHEIYINTSIGVSVYPNDSRNTITLIKNADSALYTAKELGRNIISFYSKEKGKNSGKRLNLETGLRNALVRKEFEMFYQPILNMDSRKISSAEALLRWRHPEQGLLSPNSFLSYAEDTGLIHKLGQWVITAVCTQLKEWEGTKMSRISVAINLSPLQFFRSDFLSQFKRILKDTGADPHKIIVEVTENLAMQYPETAVARLKELRQLGIQVAIDDFGIGHSSLNYLKIMPADKIKIDKSFVQSSVKNYADTAIIHAVSTLARSLNMQVVGEGVEEIAQLQHLATNDYCDEIQGYLISKPLSVSDFSTFLTEFTHHPPLYDS